MIARKMRRAAAVAAAGTLMAGMASAAPQPYAGGTYSQNFDGLPSIADSPAAQGATITVIGRGPHDLDVGTNWGTTGTTSMTGWTGGNPSGSSGNTEFRSQDGSLAGGDGRGLISYGTNGSAERALGALPTSNQISRFGLTLVNNSSDTYQQVNISYTGEQWRRGGVTSPNTLAFAYGVAVADINAAITPFSSLDFLSANTQVSPTEVALNGNLPANQDLISDTITGLNWAPGTTLTLRWTINDLSGQDDGLGIDNFSLTAAVPEPASIAGIGALGLGLLSRRRRSAI